MVGAVAVAVVLFILLTNRASPIEAAVADQVGTSASDVSCEKSPKDVLENNFYCEVDLDDGLTACYDVYADPATGEFDEPGLFRVGVATDGCDEVFRRL